ncbi:MAG: transposase [Flavobacteriales bacterium]|nr:MAG: transposase [Flavobacteriales bacterium]
MDGKGQATDNAFIERLWRSVKQQCVYRHSPADGNELRSLLAEYFAYYNHQRPHQHLDGLTPGTPLLWSARYPEPYPDTKPC